MTSEPEKKSGGIFAIIGGIVVAGGVAIKSLLIHLEHNAAAGSAIARFSFYQLRHYPNIIVPGVALVLGVSFIAFLMRCHPDAPGSDALVKGLIESVIGFGILLLLIVGVVAVIAMAFF